MSFDLNFDAASIPPVLDRTMPLGVPSAPPAFIETHKTLKLLEYLFGQELKQGIAYNFAKQSIEQEFGIPVTPELEEVMRPEYERALTSPRDQTGVLVAYSASEWLERNDIPEADPILGTWLHTTSKILVVGPTGLGKTMFGLAMALNVAVGATRGRHSFMHWQLHQPRRVLYVDGEMPRRLLMKRLREEAGFVDKQALDRLFLLSREDCEDMRPLNTPEGQQQFDATLSTLAGQGFKPDLIVFDNIQSLLSGEMKEGEQWRETFSWSRQLAKRNTAQLWFHHTGHDESHSYGDKSREWGMDAFALMERTKAPDLETLAFKLTFHKQRENDRTPQMIADFSTMVITRNRAGWEALGVAGNGAIKGTGVGGDSNTNLAYEVLADLIANEGTHLPTGMRSKGDDIPDNVLCIQTEMWRDALYGRGFYPITDDMDKIERTNTMNSRKTAWKRLQDKLKNAGEIGSVGTWTWIK